MRYTSSLALVLSLLVCGCSETGLSSSSDGNGVRDGDGSGGDQGDNDGNRDEECNGIDDDGDGQVDEGFPDTDGDGIADCLDDECDLLLDAGGPVSIDEDCLAPDQVVTDPWDVRIEWQWTGLAANPAVSNVIMTPVVGNLTDTDGDGDIDTDDTPDVAFVAFSNFGISSGTLVVVPGVGGTERWSSAGWNGGGGIALADVDGDGLTDVVGFDASGRPRAVSHDGRDLWTASSTVGTTYPQATVADIDGDGQAEVIADTLILDGLTGAIEQSLTISSGIPYRLPAVADLDLDGEQEVILGNTVYRANGDRWWSSSVTGGYGHWAAILDADGDPEAEVAMVGGGRLAIYEHDGTERTNVAAGGTQPGAPCVADFDGDGEAEIAWGSSNTVNLYELDGTRRWSAAVDDSSGLASCSGYDVDGDGAFEVLFADQNTFHIFDGITGAVRYSQGGHASGTLWEYPSVADLDNDGSAEVVIGSNNYSFGGWTGITVFGHSGDGWMKSGTTWHTHDFAVTNINTDGTVPTSPEPWWQTYNVYRARPAVDSAATDLQVRITDLCFAGCEADNLVEVAVQVSNVGGVAVPAGVPVSLYADDAGRLILLDTQVIPDEIPAGTALPAIPFTLTAGEFLDGLVARVDDDGTGGERIVECDEGNNEDRYDDSPCP